MFFGFELMETLPNDPAAPACKLLLGRLYNGGVKLAAICETFAVDPKTVRGWGRALSQGDPAELIRVLEGRGARRKRTTEVENFARFRWPEPAARGSYGAVGRLQREIEGVFGVALSRSGLQSLIRELKATPLPALRLDAVLPAEGPVGASPGPDLENGETSVRCLAEGLGIRCPRPRSTAASRSQPRRRRTTTRTQLPFSPRIPTPPITGATTRAY